MILQKYGYLVLKKGRFTCIVCLLNFSERPKKKKAAEEGQKNSATVKKKIKGKKEKVGFTQSALAVFWL